MGKISLDSTKIEELLTRGVEEIIDRDNLLRRLQSGKPLRIKLGIDPTSPNLHLGRSIPLLKLRDFQELGHQVVFIIGDFTGLIGDSSDKKSERPMLTEEEVKENAKTYIQQAAKLIDIDRAEVYYNSQWLKKLDYLEVNRQADQFSLSEFIARENIRDRLRLQKRISLREILYPLMQGYDSVQVKADVEVGGTDQRFNLLVGRDMQRFYKQPPQDIITNPLVEGLDGRKMSSSFANSINLLDEPNEMFGRVMSLNDELIIRYFTLLTRVPQSEIDQYQSDLDGGTNPRDIKLKLAEALVEMYYSDNQAKQASDYFLKTFSEKKIPSVRPIFKPNDYNLISVLVDSGLSASRSEARRLIKQGGLKVNGTAIKDFDYIVSAGAVIQKGKIKFLEIK